MANCTDCKATPYLPEAQLVDDMGDVKVLGWEWHQVMDVQRPCPQRTANVNARKYSAQQTLTHNDVVQLPA